jgi:hypothetical protein
MDYQNGILIRLVYSHDPSRKDLMRMRSQRIKRNLTPKHGTRLTETDSCVQRPPTHEIFTRVISGECIQEALGYAEWRPLRYFKIIYQQYHIFRRIIYLHGETVSDARYASFHCNVYTQFSIINIVENVDVST